MMCDMALSALASCILALPRHVQYRLCTGFATHVSIQHAMDAQPKEVCQDRQEFHAATPAKKRPAEDDLPNISKRRCLG
ncbi:uncharacterized protein M421DRAFT_422539 [Didymella exigua CBS 183.55]|uniref:Secreted protein n=1 Tax=Didymella exigua CBS 183.55 TaxID=1150837 RepID=A0A6A5RE64_9PLEO|nr:uncharacterized protein M421DRAFT_422539 [Didymella exigua CBS 183.55]KAF1926565.1 hypothetical protein M421DRAFT_422539 [Didymella exigua CBS 183.55]